MSRCATPPTTPSPLPFHCPSPLPTFRNLGPDQLAGVIFTCTEDSLDDCLRAGVFGLPRTHFQYVQHVRPSMVLFLFNFSTRDLHGIFRAMTGGKIDGEPQGVNPEWAANFPAQVDVDTSDTYPPLPETAFRRIISENYISNTSSQFSFELDMDQVARLSAAFKQFSINRSTPTPQNPIPQFNLPNPPPPVPLLGGGGGGGGDLKPATPWPNEKTRRLSPVPRHPIRDLFIPGRPKSSMDYLAGHAPPFDVDLNLFGGGGSRLDSNQQMNNLHPPQLQGSGLSLDPNLLQMNQLPNLLGVNPAPSPLLNQLDLQTVQALQKARLRQESPWGGNGGGLDPNESVLPVAGMMSQLNPQETASSQLLNQTQMGLGLNPAAPAIPPNQGGGGGGIRGRFSTGNLSPVDPIDHTFANDSTAAMNALKLTEQQQQQQNLDFQISQAINILNPEERQQSKIWKVSPKDKGLVTDPAKLYAEAFKFPEKSSMFGMESTGLQSQRFSGTLTAEGQEGTTGRYQETWGGPNPATWKPPRPHSSAEGELDPFSRNTIPGLSTMYPTELKAQVQEIPDEVDFTRPKSVSRASGGKPGLKTKSRNNDETAILSDGGTPSENGAESPPKDQVNIKALEDESIAITQFENVGGGYPTNDLFLDKTTGEKGPVFGFTSGEYYPSGGEELGNKRNNFLLVNALNGGGPGIGGQNLMTMHASNVGPGADFSDLLQPTRGLDLGMTNTTGGGGGGNLSNPRGGRSESEMISRLVLENERLRTECTQLQKQITSVKNKKPLDYASIHTSSSDVKTVTEMVLLGGLLDTNIIKVINPELPEQMKRIEIDFNFCRGAGVNIGSHVFLMGGTSLETPNKLMTGMYRLDPSSSSSGDEALKPMAPMKQGRCLFNSVSSGMKIFTIGGLTEQGPTNTVEIYDPILDSWIPGPCLNHAKHSLGTAVVNSIIYSVGGQSEKGPLQTVEMLDPREGKWIQIGSLSWSRSGLTCCPVFNHLFAVGGQNGRSVLNSAEILDLRKGIVNESLTMIEPRQYGVAIPIENSVYLIGGLQTLESDNNSKFSKPEVFNTLLSTSSLVSHISEDQLSMVFHSACPITHCLY